MQAVAMIGRRVLTALLALLIALLIMTAAEAMIGPEVARTLAGPKASGVLIASLNHELGLDRTFGQRLARWFAGAIHGDLGRSFSYRLPVIGLLLDALALSAGILIPALLIGLVIGIPLGIWAARGRTVVRSGVIAIGSSLALLPSLIPSTLFAYAFGIRLGWLPSPRTVSIAIVSLTPLAVVALATLGEFERILASNHFRFARSLGYGDGHLILACGLKEALPGLSANLSNVILYLVTATVFVEIVFAEHGLGQLLLDATQRLDYPIILGFGLLMVVVIGVTNLLTGLVLYATDPRVR